MLELLDIIGDGRDASEQGGRVFDDCLGYLQPCHDQCNANERENAEWKTGTLYEERTKVEVIIAQCPSASRWLQVYLLPLYSYTTQHPEVLVSLRPKDSMRQDRDTSDTDPADRQRFCQSRRVEGGRFVREAIDEGTLYWEDWLD